MNNIFKSGDKESIVINGGIDGDRIGVKLISPGSHLFATNNNFLFFSDQKSDKTFHVNTSHSDSGIILENGKKNKISMAGNRGTQMDFSRLQVTVSEIANYCYNEKLVGEYRQGYESIISGGDLRYIFKEKLDYRIESEKGSIIFNNFRNFQMQGEEIFFKSGKNQWEVNRNKFGVNCKKIEILSGEKGISIEENITIVNDNDLKLITTNGNLEIENRNGDKISIVNSRPNGNVEIISNKVIQKTQNSIISTNNLRIDIIENISINSLKDSSFDINTGNFTLDVTNINFFGEHTILSGKTIETNYERIILNKSLLIEDEDLKLNQKNIRLIGEDIELNANRISFKYHNNEFVLNDQGWKYGVDNSIFRVVRDEIKMISDGSLGISIGAERGGIKMSGSIDWVYNGNKLLESVNNRLKIGHNNWDVILEGNNVKMIGELEMRSGRFTSRMKGGSHWQMNNSEFLFGDLIRLGTAGCKMELADEYKIMSGSSELVVNSQNVKLFSENIGFGTQECHLNISDTFMELKSKNNRIILDDLVTIGGDKINLRSGMAQIEMNENHLFLRTEKGNEIYNVNISADRNITLEGAGLDIEVRTYNGKYEQYYGIVKGGYEMNFLGDNYIKSQQNVLEIGGPHLIIGDIKMQDGMLVETSSMIIQSPKINLSDMVRVDDIEIFSGYEENYLKIGKNVGIELVSRFTTQILGSSINIFSKNVLSVGNELHNLKIERGSMELNGGLRGNGNQFVLGWSNYNLGMKERVIYLGGEGSNLLINEGNLVIESKVMKMKSNSLDLYHKNMNCSIDNLKIDVKNLWLGDSQKIMMNEKMIEIKGKKIRVDTQTVMDIGDIFQVENNGNFFKLSDKLLGIYSRNVDWNFSVDIKGEVAIQPSKNLRLESTVGDVFIGSQSGGILLDGMGKIMKLNGDGDYLSRFCGKYSVYGKELLLDMEKSGKIMVRGEAGFEIESVGELKVSSGDLSIRSKMMELSGSKMDISIDKNIRIGSESFGYFVLNEDGGTIESANHLEILVKNPVSRMRVETGGMCEFLVGKNLELDIKGKMSVIIEEGMTLGTRSSITMVGKEFIRLEGGDLRLIYGDGLIQGKKLKGDIKDVDLEVMNMRVKQTGFGEYVVDTEGKIGLYNKLDGHSARVIEIKVDGNSHEDSLYLGSRSGGVSIEGQRINMNGIVHMERIKTGDRLRIDGDVDLRSLKIGDNLFLEGRGMTMVNRERFEWRNMDVKIGGMLEVGEIRSSKIDGRGGVDIIGDVRIQGGLELGGPLKLKGGSIGDGREFMNIKLGDEYVSNVGIKIQSGQKVGIDIEGGIALKADGRIEVGGILVENELGGQLDELEAGDISSILEDLRVEKDQNGKLKLLKKGKIDLMDTLVKLVALVTHKYNI